MDYAQLHAQYRTRERASERSDYSRSREQAFLQKLQAWYSSDGDLSAPRVSMAPRKLLFPPHNGSGLTPLFHAADCGWSLAVDWLLAHGAGVDDLSELRSRAPLHTVVLKDNEIIAKRLLDAGAQVDVCDDRGETSLRYACRYDYINMCKLLLSRGADPHLRDDGGELMRRASKLLEVVCASGGWKPYVDAPRKALFKFRKALPTLQRGPSSVPAKVERLFTDSGIPDEVFRHVLAFWRSARDY